MERARRRLERRGRKSLSARRSRVFPQTCANRVSRPVRGAARPRAPGLYWGRPARALNPASLMAKASRRRSTRATTRSKARMVFARTNYLILIASVALVVVGYTVMRMENAVDGFLSLYVAPVLILGGYLGVIAAILWRPKETEGEATA